MQCQQYIQHKIQTINSLKTILQMLKFANKKVVFTNGCFDIIHPGHIQTLHTAAQYAHYLIVGVNSDESVKRLKGLQRPINNTESRCNVLANLTMVDAVIVFEEDTPIDLINAIKPDVLVKGGDYKLNEIVGANEVIANGGQVKIVPTLIGYSTTNIINKMRKE